MDKVDSECILCVYISKIIRLVYYNQIHSVLMHDQKEDHLKN